jgi:hypothetical protein
MGWRPQPDEKEPKRAGLPDNQEAVRLCWILSGCKGWRETLREVRRLRAHTIELVEANWPAVVALSSELLQRRDLNQVEVAAVLQRHSLAISA